MGINYLKREDQILERERESGSNLYTFLILLVITQKMNHLGFNVSLHPPTILIKKRKQRLEQSFQKAPPFATEGDLTFSNQPQYSGLQCAGEDTAIGLGVNGPADPFQFVKQLIKTFPSFPSLMAS